MEAAPASRPSLHEILFEVKKITKIYMLGIHLNIKPEIIKKIEKNHERDVDRQRAEVITYWLENFENCSWEVLAKAVERLGEYANVVTKLREHERSSQNSAEVSVSDIDTTYQRPPKNVDHVACTSESQEKPRIADLRKCVWRFIENKWEEVAAELGLEDEDDVAEKLDHIREHRSGDKLMASLDILKLWLKSQRERATWAVLIEALQKVNLQEAMNSVRSFLSGNSCVTVQQSSVQIESSQDPSSSGTSVSETVTLPSNNVSDSNQPSHQSTESKSKQSSPKALEHLNTGVTLQQPVSPSTGWHVTPPPNPALATAVTKDYMLQMKAGQKIRMYQHELARPGINGENYIVFAPAGSGKTLVSAKIICEHLGKRHRKHRTPRVAFVVKTRPLAEQQRERLAQYIPDARVECCIGDREQTTFRKIKEVLPYSEIIVCTSGKLLNEMRRKDVALQTFSLMVFDECHNAERKSPYAQVMHQYLELKENEAVKNLLPQIVGLTSTPGSARNPSLDSSKAIDSLTTLCALLDATSGIKSVQEYKDELDEVIHKPNYQNEIIDHTEDREAFIWRIEQEMILCEQYLNFNSKFSRSSQQYSQTVQEKKQSIEEAIHQDKRDKVSTIRLLECYSQTLQDYLELPRNLAIERLEAYDELQRKLTTHEMELARNFEKLTVDLTSMPAHENPTLIRMEEILADAFRLKPMSEGIVFVRTREQAKEISKWISNSHSARAVGIRPSMLIGHVNHDGELSMSQEEQSSILRAFHEGKCNLLVSTSVAEEGLDIKQCNLVMRLHVSNHTAKAQMEGRARAKGSEIITVISNNPDKLYKDMLCDGQLALTQELVRKNCLLSSEQLLEEIERKQAVIVEKLRSERILEELRTNTHSAHNVQLKCVKCDTFACNATDIFVIDNTNHHVVPGDNLAYEQVEHDDQPGFSCGDIYIKSSKIHCANCNQSWGKLGVWPAKLLELPVLKCHSFNFVVDGISANFGGKWSKRPFKVSPLSEWIAQWVTKK